MRSICLISAQWIHGLLLKANSIAGNVKRNIKSAGSKNVTKMIKKLYKRISRLWSVTHAATNDRGQKDLNDAHRVYKYLMDEVDEDD